MDALCQKKNSVIEKAKKQSKEQFPPLLRLCLVIFIICFILYKRFSVVYVSFVFW